MRLFVTGGLGFIGSNFIRYILHRYPKTSIVNFDKQTYASCKASLKDLSGTKRYRFVKGDICDKKAVKNAMAGCSAVINFAAESHVDRSIKDPVVFLKTNIIGVEVLLNVARSMKMKKFIQISTDEVYGSRLRGSFKEGDIMEPNSPYSASKASADLIVRAYSKTYNFHAMITRSSNNFGPFQFPEKVIPLFITNLLENKKVPLYGDGGNIRDWIYVIDNCAGIDLVLRKGKGGEIYNIGAGNEISNMELTRTIIKILGKSDKYIKHVKDRPGHDRRYSINTGKISKLGFKTQVSFSEAILSTVNWYKANRSWWMKLKKRY